ncbi:hypothetical protein [Burkholderia ubonensis]|uniref:hypothetical protein n=1 Tax=Burkholderia ubonensis TaxID=101571 RepID=UPI000A8FBB8A|nr:hypothetical protein [Burkholderia ubonensis]
MSFISGSSASTPAVVPRSIGTDRSAANFSLAVQHIANQTPGLYNVPGRQEEHVARAPQRPAATQKAFIEDLVRINNERGVDGIRGREEERVTWFEQNYREDGRVMRSPDLSRQFQQKFEFDILAKPPALLVSAGISPMKNAADLARTKRFIDAASPRLQVALKEEAAAMLPDIRSKDDKNLAMAIAKERAASGTHLGILDLEHGPFSWEEMKELSLAAAICLEMRLARVSAHSQMTSPRYGTTAVSTPSNASVCSDCLSKTSLL